jgi:hypothetical protein
VCAPAQPYLANTATDQCWAVLWFWTDRPSDVRLGIYEYIQQRPKFETPFPGSHLEKWGPSNHSILGPLAVEVTVQRIHFIAHIFPTDAVFYLGNFIPREDKIVWCENVLKSAYFERFLFTKLLLTRVIFFSDFRHLCFFSKNYYIS